MIQDELTWAIRVTGAEPRHSLRGQAVDRCCVPKTDTSTPWSLWVDLSEKGEGFQEEAMVNCWWDLTLMTSIFKSRSETEEEIVQRWWGAHSKEFLKPPKAERNKEGPGTLRGHRAQSTPSSQSAVSLPEL